MMIYDPAQRRAAEARALAAALTIAARADWRFDRPGTSLSTPFAGYLYVDVAQLLLVPTSAALPFARRLVDGAVREARSDALIVSSAKGQLAFALGLWSSAGTTWHMPVTPWLGDDGVLWMVADDDAAPDTAPADIGFSLRKGRIVAEPTPWLTPLGRAAGENRATTWLAGMMG